MPSDGVPYPIFAYVALLPWQLFAFALTESSNSLVASQNLITKVYFPRLVIPISSVLAGLVDFAIAFVILLAHDALLRHRAHRRRGPAALISAVGRRDRARVGLWLSALNVKYRDVRYTIPFLTQFWMFATPVAYPSSLVPARLARALRTEPHGRGRRRIPLGAARQIPCARPAAVGLDRRRGGAADRRPALFQENGKHLRRYCVTLWGRPSFLRGLPAFP